MSADRDGNRSNPYRPDPAQCCEACVFGKGQHAFWCKEDPWMVYIDTSLYHVATRYVAADE